MRAELAARFASPAVLPEVRLGWTDAAQDSAVLPLLLRYAPAEAVSRIEKSQLQGVKGDLFYETNTVFKARGAAFPAELTDLLRRQLRSGTDDQTDSAAYELSLGGAPEDRYLLEQRLGKLRAEWSSRADEVASAAPSAQAIQARKLEVELMSALRQSAVWNMSDDDAAQLALECLSDQCRRYGKPRGNNQSNQAN